MHSSTMDRWMQYWLWIEETVDKQSERNLELEEQIEEMNSPGEVLSLIS